MITEKVRQVSKAEREGADAYRTIAMIRPRKREIAETYPPFLCDFHIMYPPDIPRRATMRIEPPIA